jgi:hypothetical protein
MAKAKTWLWIILGFVGACVLGMVMLAGAGVYFVSHHIAVRPSNEAAAVRTFDEARAMFKNRQPVLELDEFERPHETRPLSELPTSSTRPENLIVLAWNPREGRLARVALPFWILRLGRRKIGVGDAQGGFDFDRLQLDVGELERIGPALVLDYTTNRGERVLIWTQ